ncbi:unnamed protein product, partial [Cyprideis torosa]
MKPKPRNDDSEPSTSGGDSTERGNWGSQLEFVLSCLSYAVGLGNIWRFPYLCYRNGGGAFLIPYAIMLLTCGLPLFFFELSLGQYVREGPITVWKICPIFGGVGYAMFMISFVVGIYYNMIIAWALYYLWSSLSSSLPWTSCDNLWNTEACQRYDPKNCTSLSGFLNLTTGDCIINGTVSDDEWAALKNASEALKMPADEFFHNFVLGISAGIHHFGELRYPLVICLLVAWLILFSALLKGVKSFGKAVYFTAIFPYIVLIVLLVRAATLPGYMDGIMFYLTPEWKRLLDPSVWADAATQIFFSLSPCWGGLITLASYNKFNNNHFRQVILANDGSSSSNLLYFRGMFLCEKNKQAICPCEVVHERISLTVNRDAIVVTLGNCLTSFFSGFVIFGILGFMAYSLGVPVEE